MNHYLFLFLLFSAISIVSLALEVYLEMQSSLILPDFLFFSIPFIWPVASITALIFLVLWLISLKRPQGNIKKERTTSFPFLNLAGTFLIITAIILLLLIFVISSIAMADLQIFFGSILLLLGGITLIASLVFFVLWLVNVRNPGNANSPN